MIQNTSDRSRDLYRSLSDCDQDVFDDRVGKTLRDDYSLTAYRAPSGVTEGLNSILSRQCRFLKFPRMGSPAQGCNRTRYRISS